MMLVVGAGAVGTILSAYLTAAKREPADVTPAHADAHAAMSAELLQAVIDAARAGLPNEACGLSRV